MVTMFRNIIRKKGTSTLFEWEYNYRILCNDKLYVHFSVFLFSIHHIQVSKS